MFSKFKILVIYLIIPSICANVTPSTDEKTTLNLKDQVKEELSSIEDNLKKIMDPLTNNEEKLELKGVIRGEVKKIIERAVNAEREVKILIEDQGGLKKEKENIKLKALKTFAVPYLCRNLELYESVWDCGGKNSLNFDPDDIDNTEVRRHDLDTQTSSNYKSHAKKWDRILTSSTHPLAKKFKTKIQLLYPEVSLQIIAKHIGLTHALLNNAKHGAMTDDPDIKALINPDELILALKKWDAFTDPVVLDIIKTFEQVISGL